MSSKEAAARDCAASSSHSTRPTNPWKRRAGWIAGSIAVLAIASSFRSAEGPREAAAQAPATATAAVSPDAPLPSVGRPEHDVMAIVNGQDISRQKLADACVSRYGEDVLESIVNKRLIENHCKKRQITVTNEEIAAEIDRMAQRFQLGRDQWLEMLQKERGIAPQEYARDIVWPTLALRKLAGDSIKPTTQEINQVYDREYGERIRARLIAVTDRAKAQKLQQELTAHPEAFPRAAIENSEDVNSASIGGLIQDIRRNLGDPAIEAAAFALQPGQVSQVLQLGNKYILLKCETRVAARPTPLAQVQPKIEDQIREEKLRGAANDLFASLQKTATIQNVVNDPRLSQTMPGVVATVNGDRILKSELDKECLTRHGEEVLEIEISHLLLEQSLKAANLKIERADLDAEMAHAAELAGVVDKAGKPDLKRWIETATSEQGVTEKEYLRDSVWPSAALKKLTAQEVVVDQADIRKSFEANFGERVECRAIVLDNLRRAQEVWAKARQNDTVDNFGDLAEEYSIEPTSRALRGEVPPLGRHGGQEQLEDEAFKLQPGQISGIIQVEDKFIILRAEGKTKPVDVSEAEVRDDLYRDVYEKKLRMSMSQKFDQIRSTAKIDNFLAGTTSRPLEKEPGQANVRQDSAVRPTAGMR